MILKIFKKIIIKIKNKIVFQFSKRNHKTNIIEFDEKYYEKLNEFYKCPVGDIFGINNIDEKYDLHIIVPCYNTEKYVEVCVDSIINQKTKFSYFITLVNDGSTDDTLKIINKYKSYTNIEIINQENQGVSVARNSGLQNIYGKYIMFVDSDDILCNSTIENLLKYAYDNDADIVEGNYYRLINNFKVKTKKHSYDGVLNSNKLNGFPWGKVFKSYLWSDLIFPKEYWFEDTILSGILYFKKLKSYCINEYIYIYRLNVNSITQIAKKDSKCLDTFYITELIMKYHNNDTNKDSYIKWLEHQFIVNIKRVSNLDNEIKKLSLCYLHDLLNKYVDHDWFIENKFLSSIYNLDFNSYLLYEKY